jgi:acyl-CoA synthetase (AMP-forming)/AMP-acid ligase II
MKHFIDTLKETATTFPNRNAIQIVNGKSTIEKSITYAQFWENTGTLAAHFLKEGIKKSERVMIVYPNTAQLEYFTAFVACLRVGIVPVSIYPPNPQKIDQDLVKFDHFVSNAGAICAITTTEYKRFVQISSMTKKWSIPTKNWLATDSLLKKKIEYNEEDVCFTADDDDVMFIQYTSGSTGNYD